jgi:hypothetical protein
MSFGGRFRFNDYGETPNTQIALFQYEPGLLVIFQLCNVPSEKEQFIGSGELVAKANQLVTRQYRPPFVVPESV